MNFANLLVVGGAAFFLLLIIVAAYALNQNVWEWCPKCRRYHSELGITPNRPRQGRISTVPVKCPVCRKANNEL